MSTIPMDNSGGGSGGGRKMKASTTSRDDSGQGSLQHQGSGSGGISSKKQPQPQSQSQSQQQHQSSGGGGGGVSQSERSADRDPFFSNRDTVDFKWQRSSKNIVGALEVDSEPVFNPRRELQPRYKSGCEDKFHDALQAWQDLKLKQSFRQACDEELQTELCCCGFLEDPEATKKQYVKQLNDGWMKTCANKKLGTRGFKADAFLWTWQNASGKSETNIVLIRFHILSTFAFRRASGQGSLDLDDMLSSDDGDDDDDDDDNEKKGGNNNKKAKPVKPKEMAR
eukprot:CAMPEP_0113464668 /NCGR_PEP_ID=MMETSP0014_2-20120614/13322_1 /TAXON_ID=2857 /ORGANISM="Nitzschia sp." /LENGTH=281 /DNA_ID=CAMNT_0000356761 /DNA_START=93 /DNA_END=938 /DNA_ORIENTATION=- /assembly_acc=CAM_ASM_000159